MVKNMDTETVKILIRTIATLVILFILIKIIGKKQLSQMNFYDYITGITIGSIVADISLDIEKNFIAGVLSLIIYGVISVLISKICQKSIKSRIFFNGRATTLIDKGKILINNLRKASLDINELLSEARIMGYFDISNIDYAIMETNGKISFLPKEQEQPATKKDVRAKLSNTGLVYNVIIDTKVMEDTLTKIKKDKSWLDKELKVQGYKDYSNLLLVTVDNNNKVVVFEKN